MDSKNAITTPQPQSHQHYGHALAGMLGPAFVASVAYVDPGNVAANITSGARYGYLLVWVLVLANCMSVLIQYQSAKLGIVTGNSLPEDLRGTTWRRRPIHVFHAERKLLPSQLILQK